ncbi:uncharacterized protein TRIADDRAFT_62449 [Trichoplax adhaerens]|uniref:Uncharacterized protein n=1 Tax=Trichoplax adhaerens TaxID=10228 RepID=B3SDU2_TRIAD|nr:predicted protein [Trichoplax adhaerens]EDV19105.1 predicted protein [Trichoplax adhaerens]|eukprot:XP_002118411.1 predicted protein [Trichoplax adhaerens]
MYNPRKLSIIVYVGAVAMLFGGLFTYISNQVMMRSCENIFMIDLGLMGLLALTLATALLKVNDLATTSTTQASGLTALAVIISAASPAILARLVIAFFSSAVNSSLGFFVPVSIAIAGFVSVAAISIYVAVKQNRRIYSDDNEYSLVQTPFNKAVLFWAMIVTSLAIFGLSVAIFMERWYLYHVVTANFHAIMLFATGILGLIAHKKQVVDLGVWTKTFTNFTAGISAASTIAMVQTLVRYANQPGDTKWERFDFTILTLCQTLFTFIGLILSSVAIVATDNVLNKAPKLTKSSDIDTMNVGMLVSASVAGAVAIFNMAIMNYPVYGFPPVVVAIMVIVTAKHGIDIQTTDNGIAEISQP